MSEIQQFDITENLQRAILWQYNEAEKILGLSQNKQDFFNVEHSQFWLDWFNGIFNINTCNSFGISLWAIILEVPLLVNIPPFNPSGLYFGFGNNFENFENGNFAGNNGSGAVSLTIDQRRTGLKMRYQQLISRGTVPEINQILADAFGDLGSCYVRDNLDMSITYVFDFSIPPWVDFLINDLDLLPRPAAVGFNIEEPVTALAFDPLTASNVILSNSNQTAQSNYTVPSGPFGTPVNVSSETFPVLQERTISIDIDAYNGLGNTPATSIAILGLYSVVSGIGVESGITFLSDGSLITEGTFNVSGVNPLFGALPTIVLGQATTYEGLIVIKPSGNVYIGLSIGGAAPVYLSWDGLNGTIPQLDGDPVNDLNPTFTLPNNTDQYFYQIGATQQAGQPVVTWQVTADFDA